MMPLLRSRFTRSDAHLGTDLGRPAWLLALTLCLALLGCGPGVGGTGTGPNEGQNSAAPDGSGHANPTNPAPTPNRSVCQSAIAPLLSCSTTSGGTAAVWFADTANEAQVSAQMLDQGLVLTLPCRRITFEGRWTSAAMDGGRFDGQMTITPPSGASASPTTSPAVVSAGVQNDQLLLRLLDAQGQPLTEALLLLRVPAAPGMATQCP